MTKTRTKQEIKAHVKNLSTSQHVDPMGVQASTCVRFLPFRSARPYLKASTRREEWEAQQLTCTVETIHQLMAAFYESAWGAANGDETMKKEIAITLFTYEALVWLQGEDEWRAFGSRLRRGNMEFNGKPQLVMIGERYDLGIWQDLDTTPWYLDRGKFDRVPLRAVDGMKTWCAKHRVEDGVWRQTV